MRALRNHCCARIAYAVDSARDAAPSASRCIRRCKFPSRVTDLTVVEHGDQLDIDFTIPPLTTEGLPLKEIGGVELRVGPTPTNGWNVDEWAAERHAHRTCPRP